MAKASVAGMESDPLTDFTTAPFTHGGITHDVLRKGSGPAVVVMAEVPGITPKVAAFARRVAERGMTVYMPDLFGVAGAPSTRTAAIGVLTRLCVAREFRALALRTTAPVVEWLRALARAAHAECGGSGVGAVGMCFTGGFALGMATEPEMLAPVMSQPSLPVAVRIGAKKDLGLSDDDLLRVVERCREEDLSVMGLRFTGDKLAPKERFASLRQVLGTSFIDVEIDSSAGISTIPGMSPHSVLTEGLIDEPGQPTRAALDQVLDFLADRLGVG